MNKVLHSVFNQNDVRLQMHRDTSLFLEFYRTYHETSKEADLVHKKIGRIDDAFLEVSDSASIRSNLQLKSRVYFQAFVTSLILVSMLVGLSRGSLQALFISHGGIAALIIMNLLTVKKMAMEINDLFLEKENAMVNIGKYMAIAETDSLTGLPNRLALKRNLNNLSARGSLTFIDIDGLKYYNDRFGHARGDDLLRAFSASLSNHLVPHAHLHRLGGDEFAVTYSSGDIGWIVGKVEMTVAEMKAGGYESIDASCGSAHVCEAADKDQLLHLADCRMYKTKQDHKNLCRQEA